MSIEPGDMFTVVPHTMPHGVECGRWHCVVTGRRRVTAGVVIVQEIQPDRSGWTRGMSTAVLSEYLVPLEVDVDLFGSPIGGDR